VKNKKEASSLLENPDMSICCLSSSLLSFSAFFSMGFLLYDLHIYGRYTSKHGLMAEGKSTEKTG
jgi:hypothetical protein